MEIQKVGGGMYLMDGQTYDLSTLLMAIGCERAENIEAQILDQAQAMKRRNEILKGLSNIMAELRAMDDSKDLYYADTKDSGVPKPDGSGNYTVAELFNEVGIGMLEWDKEHGDADWHWAKQERQEAIEKIKGTMDSLNSDSQMDMIRLQGLVQKRDTAYESITNLMKTDQKSKDAIVSNLR